MPLTKDQLLQPRYKVIADYPGCPWYIGRILTPIGGGNYDCIEAPTINGVSNPEKYPSVFQVLPWWSDRNPEDMPDYIKVYYQKGVQFHKVSKWLHRIGEQFVYEYINDNGLPLRETTRGTDPATEEEYNAYINQYK